MRLPSPFNLLAVIALAVVTFAAPVYACVCADGTTTQAFAAACGDAEQDAPCEEGCEVTRVVREAPTSGERATVPEPPAVDFPPLAWSIAAEVAPGGPFDLTAPEWRASPVEAGVLLRCVILIV
jgi:hypothetical protein